MTYIARAISASGRVSALKAALWASVEGMQQRALALDAAAAFPEADVDALRKIGALAAPLPSEAGGLGLGVEPQAAEDLMDVLRALGRGNLSLGRLYEAHVNAIRLICRYGTPAQIGQAAKDAMDGHLFGLWVTDAAGQALVLHREAGLGGSKAPCSGAGFATRAVVTARVEDGGIHMLIVDVTTGSEIDRAGWGSHGMRAAVNGRVGFDGVPTGASALLGEPGDYLRQPDFSAGAWRTSAVTLGGMEALAGTFCASLVARDRHGDPYQAARVGQAMLAVETARMWVRRAAVVGEADDLDGADAVQIVNLARLAVEAACLELIRIVQRGLGMAAFQQPRLSELLFRDLAMYLRQPAADEILADAATHFMQRQWADLP